MTYKIKNSKGGIRLPIYKIRGKLYFRDERLGEYRNIKNPSDAIKEKDIFLIDFQKPNKKDREKISEVK